MIWAGRDLLFSPCQTFGGKDLCPIIYPETCKHSLFYIVFQKISQLPLDVLLGKMEASLTITNFPNGIFLPPRVCEPMEEFSVFVTFFEPSRPPLKSPRVLLLLKDLLLLPF